MTNEDMTQFTASFYSQNYFIDIESFENIHKN